MSCFSRQATHRFGEAVTFRSSIFFWVTEAAIRFPTKSVKRPFTDSAPVTMASRSTFSTIDMSNAKPSSSVFFVGQPHEVAHHAAPFSTRLNVRIVSAEETVEQAAQGDLAIFYSEHFLRFRNCCQELQAKNVATLYMIDGILEWRNAWENRPDELASPYTMRPVLAHKVACIGHSQARVLDAWGNAGKTEIVGIPRLDDYQTQLKEKANQADAPNDPFRVLVMTAKTPGFTAEQIETVKRSLFDLKKWQTENATIETETGKRNIEFVWRLTAGLDEMIEVENTISDLSGSELKDQLEKVDAVITTPSTAMLESMLLGLPVAVLDYHNRPHYVTGGWDICSAEHIDSTIRQMADRIETRMFFQNDELKNSLQCSTSATERFVALVEGMLSIASQKIAAQMPLEFPAEILPPLPSQSSEFSHARLYPNATEFSTDEKTTLQVELSQSRREILRLQTELAKTRSDLDNAARAFEQIEKHPIAGPVFRIRQKMLDLMAKIGNRKPAIDPTSPTNVNPSNSRPETGSN